jgi:glycosyltransferase involved in cell wall biosynthesis
MKKISIITPCYNEEETCEFFYITIRDLFNSKLSEYEREHIFCDNSSTDDTVKILRKIAASDNSVKIIINSRNYGILKNTFNGVKSATGDAILLFMPVDMQDPPELIADFVKLWESGYKVVYGIRQDRDEFFLMKNLRFLFYKIINRISYVDFPVNVGDFQLVDKVVQQALIKTREVEPFLRMMTFDVGFSRVGVPYKWRKRQSGSSKNNFTQLIDQGFIGLITFSSALMRLSLFTGLIISVLSFMYVVVIFALHFSGNLNTGKGIPTIIASIFLFGGIQLFFIGILGEYILKIYNITKNKPIVIESERINF